jgi:endoglucanase
LKVFLALLLALVVGTGLWFFFRDPYALRGSDWRMFKSRFLEPSGRIVDTGNGGISHSEGQGYGMLLAVAFNDRRSFERMWDWTQKNLRRPEDHLFAWLWKPEDGGRIGDPNNASDGDLLIAWALLRAFDRWQNFDFQRAAALILTDFQDKALVQTRIGLQMIPGLIGFETDAGVVLNPSYAIFPAYAELQERFPSPTWAPLAAGGKQLIQEARFGKWQLSPDWALVSATAVEIGRPNEPDFGYNAIRVPLHIAWQDPKSELLKPFADFWNTLPGGVPVPATVNLYTNQFGPHPALPGMLAVVELTRAAAAGRSMTVLDIPPVTGDEPYYSASLKLLTALAVKEAFEPEKH